jgi:hypothetical protein
MWERKAKIKRGRSLFGRTPVVVPRLLESLYRRICISPDGLPYLTPSKYSFGTLESR